MENLYCCGSTFGIPSLQVHPYLQGSRLGPVVRGKVPVLGGLIKAKAPIVVPKAKGPGFLPRNTVRVMCKVISPPGFYFYCAERKKKGKKFSMGKITAMCRTPEDLHHFIFLFSLSLMESFHSMALFHCH